jgi:hypothetical protein
VRTTKLHHGGAGVGKIKALAVVGGPAVAARLCRPECRLCCAAAGQYDTRAFRTQRPLSLPRNRFAEDRETSYDLTDGTDTICADVRRAGRSACHNLPGERFRRRANLHRDRPSHGHSCARPAILWRLRLGRIDVDLRARVHSRPGRHNLAGGRGSGPHRPGASSVVGEARENRRHPLVSRSLTSASRSARHRLV